MKFKKTVFTFFAALAAMGIALTSCGGGNGGGAGGGGSIDDDPVFDGELEYDDDGEIIYDNVEVTMWSIIGDPDLTIHKKLVEKFNDEYAGQIYIKLVSQAHADYYPALETTWKK